MNGANGLFYSTTGASGRDDSWLGGEDQTPKAQRKDEGQININLTVRHVEGVLL